MLTIQRQNKKIDSNKTKIALEKCFMLASRRMGSMRGVFQGDLEAKASFARMKNVA